MSRDRTNRRALNRRIGKYVKVTLTNAQLLALNTTPVQLVGALPNFVHTFDHMYITVPAQVTGATIGSATNLQVRYTNASGVQVSTNLSVTGLFDQTTLVQGYASDVGNYLTTVNAAFVLYLAGANVTGMTGTASIRLYYSTLPAQL